MMKQVSDDNILRSAIWLAMTGSGTWVTGRAEKERKSKSKKILTSTSHRSALQSVGDEIYRSHHMASTVAL
jgi:hypothetical protein